MVDERRQLVADGYDVIADRYVRWGDRTDDVKSTYIDRCLQLVPRGSRVLDLGCGTGAHVTRSLTSAYRHRHDGSRPRRRRVRRLNGRPHVLEQLGNHQNLELVRDAGFEIRTANEVTEDEDGRPVTHLWIVAARPTRRAGGV